jgi:hypothetical protein
MDVDDPVYAGRTATRERGGGERAQVESIKKNK